MIHALCESPTPELVEPFFARLPLEARGEQARMMKALTRLAEDGSVRLECHLFPALSGEAANVRRLAAQLLARMPNQTEVLRTFLLHSRRSHLVAA